MAQPRMRRILQPVEREGGVLQHKDYIHHSHADLIINLTYTGNSITQLLEQFMLDYKDGTMEGYRNPTLITAIQPFQQNEPHHSINWQGSADKFYSRIKALYDSLKDGRYPFHFRLGENWDGSNPDTMLFVGGPNESSIHVTRKSKTEHLTPFVDGRIEGGLVVLMQGGKELDREPFYKG